MSGALAMRPRLRPDLTIVRRETQGRVDFIVKEPREGKYSRFGEAEIGLMRLMDGEHTPEEIADVAAETLGVALDAGAIADFAQKLKRLGLVERTPAEQHIMLLERLRAVRKRRTRRRTRGSILRIRFSVGDPDQLFTRMERTLRWMWTPAFAWSCAALFVAYAVLLAVRWGEFWHGLADFYTVSNISAWDYLLAYVLLLSIIAIHELGHGLTTKHFGGEVHEIGAMLLYFMPALYCNTNDAWLFERRSHRLWVTFAGPWIQLVIAAVAGILLLFLEPGTFAFRLAFLTVVLGGMVNLVTNLNPLIPLDGYYALSDYLEIPNLRKRAFEYCQSFVRRRVLGHEVPAPAVTPRERRVFLIYGSLALVYSLIALTLGFTWLVMMLRRLVGPWAWLLVGFLVVRMGKRQLGRLWPMIRNTVMTVSTRVRRSRRPARLAAVGAIAVLALFLLPWTFRAKGPFQIEAARQVVVVASVPGVLDRMLVAEGDTVDVGAPLADLWSPTLETALLDGRRRVELLQAEQARAEARGDHGAAATAAAALAEAADQLAILEGRRDRLVVRAPIRGIVLGHDLDERVGATFEEGDSLLTLASPAGRTARVRVPLAAAGELSPGQHARLKISTWPGHTFTGRVATVAPAARHGWVEAAVPLPDGAPTPAPGMTGTAKIVTGRGSVAQAIERAVRRTVRLDITI
jgi:putative peptide zinc metalloprotease protein